MWTNGEAMFGIPAGCYTVPSDPNGPAPVASPATVAPSGPPPVYVTGDQIKVCINRGGSILNNGKCSVSWTSGKGHCPVALHAVRIDGICYDEDV
jgi:hypothetical protein